MVLHDLGMIKRIFGGTDSPEELRELYREAMLMTLARATHADSYTSHVEVETVRAVYQHHVGEEISSADVRVAAASDLFETAPLEKWLGGVSRRLDEAHCKSIVKALIEVIHVDGHLRTGEADFFNMVVGALRLSPIDIVEICGAD
ncbi:MAG: TerB family tellurite resistance protein [Pseudomonadales bacterium]|jgi:uncharacterized tellurite resistance protein B-like protein|nr:TerB family tellurite resistance protein [Gammaproteobacteria bacterium]MBP6052805.1 TerB family tellurite resistance protein [Pseudomonadales bacterium]MBK6584879.1 TerB family tellurite resistance protein [Gammaproteobacteria bacterium]MBK7171193.1 TerB family tellurite resistance protein [Gammaproteobacteria bacterium]MBK7519616.1 TerB family tellurite resistance protein [Gammaproteobacteria bacterium]